jgi:5-formyltetrahydrofolate cyclo-ligase
MLGKAELRKRARAAVAKLDAEEIARRSARLCAELSQAPEWMEAGVVGLFAAQSHEPSLDGLWALREARVFCYPRVNGIELDLLRIDALEELALSRWQLREPIHDPGALVSPGDVDLLLVPGTAFTERGARLGRGGGFYDRLLAGEGMRARTIGICFKEQLFEALPAEPHDRPVGRVISV